MVRYKHSKNIKNINQKVDCAIIINLKFYTTYQFVLFLQKKENKMGNRDSHSKAISTLTPRQINRITPNPQSGDWYAKIDPETGATQWIRKKDEKRN